MCDPFVQHPINFNPRGVIRGTFRIVQHIVGQDQPSQDDKPDCADYRLQCVLGRSGAQWQKGHRVAIGAHNLSKQEPSRLRSSRG